MGMKQYTVRRVPDHLDRELRRRAQQEQRSLNAVILDSLEKALQLQSSPRKNHDLDFLIGCWEEDPLYDEAALQFEQIDKDLWQ